MNFTYDKDRVNNFTDAVFAIAMTLLVLDIAVPSYQAINTESFSLQLSKLIPSFIGYTVSFMVISVYWISHMNVSRYIKHYTPSVLWINVFLLFMVVLMPFTTSFYCKTFVIKEPFILYSINVIALSLFKYLMVLRIEKEDLLHKQNHKIPLQWIKARDLASIGAWLFAIALSFEYNLLSRFAPLLMIPILKFIDIVYKRKASRKSRKKK